ncbi:hypothetical protein NDU88_003864 [Pleurodeles waltl]|uniref:Uncharacterized protein n=1 Tax=Pleurodeles waltl TaxID=8319 RepID=A0AAV7NKN3_PLEWA|nr:hypothetical protein NDU88_003864 [Pleurodeles waltl]
MAPSLPPHSRRCRSWGNPPGEARRTRAAPTVEQATMEQERAHAEVELRVGSVSSSSPLETVEQLGLDEE